MTATQTQPGLVPHAPPKQHSHPHALKRLQTWLFQPRSQSRDEAFRERTIRLTLAILMSITLFSFLTNDLFFRANGHLYPSKAFIWLCFVF
ncbi:hypothetical protein HC776_00450, partial [bacterium]|nr:hypothetical protein [bacterium]